MKYIHVVLFCLCLCCIFVDVDETKTIGIIREWKPNWEISFDINIHTEVDAYITFLWCTTHPFYTPRLIGSKIPKLLLKKDKLKIRYSINDNWNYLATHDMGYNHWRHVKILHYTSPRYPAKFKIVVDDIVVHSVVNDNPVIFNNVQCQGGFSGVKPANITNLRYKPRSEYFGTGSYTL